MADWIQALAPAATFLIAAAALLADFRVRRQQQARLVYARVSQIEYHSPGDLLTETVSADQMGLLSATVANRHDAAYGASLQALEPAVVVTARVHNLSQELLPMARFASSTEPTPPIGSTRLESARSNPGRARERSSSFQIIVTQTRPTSVRFWRSAMLRVDGGCVVTSTRSSQCTKIPRRLCSERLSV